MGALIVERVTHTGAVILSALVDDGAGPLYLFRTYYGYTVTEARSAYRAYCRENELRIVGAY